VCVRERERGRERDRVVVARWEEAESGGQSVRMKEGAWEEARGKRRGKGKKKQEKKILYGVVFVSYVLCLVIISVLSNHNILIHVK